jgi:hypothetical protein
MTTSRNSGNTDRYQPPPPHFCQHALRQPLPPQVVKSPLSTGAKTTLSNQHYPPLLVRVALLGNSPVHSSRGNDVASQRHGIGNLRYTLDLKAVTYSRNHFWIPFRHFPCRISINPLRIANTSYCSRSDATIVATLGLTRQDTPYSDGTSGQLSTATAPDRANTFLRIR